MGWEAVGELRGMEGGETIIRIYNVRRKSIFNQRGKYSYLLGERTSFSLTIISATDVDFVLAGFVST